MRRANGGYSSVGRALPLQGRCQRFESAYLQVRSIAQLVEHLPYKQNVNGSSPFIPNFLLTQLIRGAFVFVLRRCFEETPGSYFFEIRRGYCIMVVPLPSKQEARVRFPLPAFFDSSVVEQSAVNRLVVGSNPTRGA